jgi:AcrR family transcriptional regulator
VPRPPSDIRLRIVHAARAIFAAQGVDGAALRAIARAARTNIGMIYYYFPSKDDLFLAVVEEHYQRLLDDVAGLLAQPLPFEDRLRALYRRVGALDGDELEVMRLVVRESLSSQTRFHRLVDRALRGHIPMVMKLVEEGVRDGKLDAARHPAMMMVSTVALAALPQMALRALPLPGVPAQPERADELVDILLHGIAASPR